MPKYQVTVECEPIVFILDTDDYDHFKAEDGEDPSYDANDLDSAREGIQEIIETGELDLASEDPPELLRVTIKPHKD